MLCGLTSCDKETKGFDEVPSLRIVEVNPTTVTQFEDSIIISIEYKDLDGDLGHPHPDSPVLFIQDMRLAVRDPYHVQPLAPVGSTVPIIGVLDFKLFSTWLIGNGDEETTTYEIQMKDRSGNWSNIVRTPEITILR